MGSLKGFSGTVFFKHHNQSRFIYNIDVELLKHGANLQRALDGKDPFYVPTSGQADKIAAEQDRLKLMRLGCAALARVWNITPEAGKEIPERARPLLVKRAHEDAARVLKSHRTGTDTYERYSAEDVEGLEQLFHYLDAKMCLMTSANKPCPEYATLGAEIGYTYGRRGAGSWRQTA